MINAASMNIYLQGHVSIISGVVHFYFPQSGHLNSIIYNWCEIGSIYGSPTDCIWGGGRIELSDASAHEVFALLNKYSISARLTFSNSLLTKDHLNDRTCNDLCRLLESTSKDSKIQGGVIVHSDLLLDYLTNTYPSLYYVSSTTKVLTDFDAMVDELNREEFKYIVPDFRLNKALDKLNSLSDSQKNKIEFLCNECCYFGCTNRKRCYEEVSRKNIGVASDEFICTAPNKNDGYKFSEAMENPGFISVSDIQEKYLPMGFSNFKIEGRSLGSALILEFLLYYMVKPQYQIHVREHIYLSNMLDLF